MMVGQLLNMLPVKGDLEKWLWLPIISSKHKFEYNKICKVEFREYVQVLTNIVSQRLTRLYHDNLVVKDIFSRPKEWLPNSEIET